MIGTILKICPLLFILFLSLACEPTVTDLDIPIYTYKPADLPASSTQPQNNHSQPPPLVKDQSDIIREILINDKNNIFSIGIPTGFMEKTSAIAQTSFDLWFEYLPIDAKLEVNGIEVVRNPSKWETKIGYLKAVTRLSYQIYNTTSNSISYNLHLFPSKPGYSIPVTIRQRWDPIPPIK